MESQCSLFKFNMQILFGNKFNRVLVLFWDIRYVHRVTDVDLKKVEKA